jgi:hypothetical protein
VRGWLLKYAGVSRGGSADSVLGLSPGRTADCGVGPPCKLPPCQLRLGSHDLLDDPLSPSSCGPWLCSGVKRRGRADSGVAPAESEESGTGPPCRAGAGAMPRPGTSMESLEELMRQFSRCLLIPACCALWLVAIATVFPTRVCTLSPVLLFVPDENSSRGPRLFERLWRLSAALCTIH